MLAMRYSHLICWDFVQILPLSSKIVLGTFFRTQWRQSEPIPTDRVAVNRTNSK